MTTFSIFDLIYSNERADDSLESILFRIMLRRAMPRHATKALASQMKFIARYHIRYSCTNSHIGMAIAMLPSRPRNLSHFSLAHLRMHTPLRVFQNAITVTYRRCKFYKLNVLRCSRIVPTLYHHRNYVLRANKCHTLYFTRYIIIDIRC